MPNIPEYKLYEISVLITDGESEYSTEDYFWGTYEEAKDWSIGHLLEWWGEHTGQVWEDGRWIAWDHLAKRCARVDYIRELTTLRVYTAEGVYKHIALKGLKPMVMSEE